MNSYVECLKTCLDFVGGTLNRDEAVIQVEEGQTVYGKNVQLVYLVRIGTFEHMTGNMPINLRHCVVRVSSNAPHEANSAPMSFWVPLGHSPV